MAPLLLAVEQGEVALEESREVVAAPANVVGGDHRVVEQSLGLGVIRQRYGGISGGITPRGSS